MIDGEAIVYGILVSFAIVVVLMPAFIRLLKRVGLGKRIRLEGPQTHYAKEGTPAMGGLLIVLVVLGVAAILELMTGDFLDGSTIAPLATLALVGLLGTADDWLNARTGDGISAIQKLLWQTVVAGVVAWQIQNTYQIDQLAVPFIGAVDIHPIAFTFGQPNLAELTALIIGALLAFLWFNVHPAQIFMGDSGSLALGATLAVTAVITGQVLLLPLIGLVFVLETVSVILQVASVKLRGKRIFKMSPLHHHFELAGWDEEKITLRFWIIGALAALVGVAFYMATVGLLS
jgi:phospho-N-acetylmuramoyl-pentapeptide-transferase